jgi:hypothetical protein
MAGCSGAKRARRVLYGLAFAPAFALLCARGAAGQAAPAPADADDESDELGARAVAPPLPRTARQLDSNDARALPGAFGDPFRAVHALPGVTPIASGLPYVYVRGAPPASTLYYYDDVPLPSLFHLALGPAVIHPGMLGDIELYSGVPPARYGRHTGGVIAAQRRALGDARVPAFGELELRAIDVNGLLFTPLGAGGLTIAGRYGYPGPVISALSDGVSLDYWDYQLQLRQPLQAGTTAEVSWFGAYDRLETARSFESTFHRLELRLLRDAPSFQFGGALLLGYDATSNSNGQSSLEAQLEDVETQRAAPRVWLNVRGNDGLRLRVGADIVGVSGKLRAQAPPAGPQAEPVVVGPSDSTSFIDELYASVGARNTLGAYADLTLWPLPHVQTALGARADLWITGSDAQPALSPRTVVTWFPHDAFDVHAGISLSHQPAVFLLPLPGVADIALARGLQSAVQAEVGVAAAVGDAFRGELQLYAHRYADLLFPELALEKAASCDQTPWASVCVNPGTYPRATALAYGAEVMLRSSAHERLSGWITYTLGRATAESDAGFEFTPRFDLRHVGNLVLRYRVFGGFSVGGRAFARSGQVITQVAETGQRVARRLPGFYRLDARVVYAWTASFAELELSLEWLNLAFTREPLSFSCGLDVTIAYRPPPDETCRVRYAPPLVIPNLGLRAQF